MKFKLVYILHFVIICLVIHSIVIEVFIFNHYFEMTGDPIVIQNIRWHYVFKSSLISLIPLLGVFIRKPLGWFLIVSYFFYLIFNILIMGIEELHYVDYTFYLALIVMVSLALLSNHKNITKYYRFTAFNGLRHNLIPAIIGFGISLISLIARY